MVMQKDLTKSIGELNKSAKEYFQTRVDLIKLSMLEKTTKISSFLLTYWILATFLIWIIAFVAAAFAIWYGLNYGNYFTGLLIAAGCLMLLAVLFVLFRQKIVTTLFLRNFSEILLEEEEK